MKFFSGIKYCMGPGPVPSHQNASGVSLPDMPTDIIHNCTVSMAPASYLPDPPSVYRWPFNRKEFLAVWTIMAMALLRTTKH